MAFAPFGNGVFIFVLSCMALNGAGYVDTVLSIQPLYHSLLVYFLSRFLDGFIRRRLADAPLLHWASVAGRGGGTLPPLNLRYGTRLFAFVTTTYALYTSLVYLPHRTHTYRAPRAPSTRTHCTLPISNLYAFSAHCAPPLPRCACYRTAAFPQFSPLYAFACRTLTVPLPCPYRVRRLLCCKR